MRRIELVKTAMVATVIATSAMIAGCGKKAPEINTESVIEEVKEKKEQVDKAIEDVNEASEKLVEKIDAIEVPAPKEKEEVAVAENEMGYTHEQAEKLTKEEWARVDEAIDQKLSEEPEKYATMTLEEYVGDENVDLYYENVYKPRLKAAMHGYYSLEEIGGIDTSVGAIKDKPLQYLMSEEREKELIEEEENMHWIHEYLEGNIEEDPNEKSAAEQIAELQNPSDEYVPKAGQGASYFEGMEHHTGHTWETNGSQSGIFHPGD